MKIKECILKAFAKLDSDNRKTYSVLGYIILFGLIFRIAGLMIVSNDFFMHNDGVEYHDIAQNLAEGHGFSSVPRWYETPAQYDGEIRTDYTRPPVMPIIGALLFFLPFDWFVLAKILVTITAAVGIYCVFLLAREIFDKNSIAVLAALVFTFYPYSLLYSLYWSSENFFLIFFVLSILFTIKALKKDFDWRQSALGGVFLALAILTRPQGAIFFMLLGCAGIVLLIKTKRSKMRLVTAGISFCIAAGVVFTPWMIRNYLAGGTPTPLTFYGPYSLAQANSDIVYVTYLYLDTPEYQRKTDAAWNEFHKEKIDFLVENQIHDLISANKYWSAWAKNYIVENPDRFLYIVFSKVVHFFRPAPNIAAIPYYVVILLYLYFIFFWTLFLYGVWNAQKNIYLPLLLLPILTGLSQAFMFLMVLRYRYPFFAPFAAILVAYALWYIMREKNKEAAAKTDIAQTLQ